jgi:hypothetical protein
MGFDEAVAVLRSWLGRPVVVMLEPDGTEMRGRLSELEATGGDSAMFAVDAQDTSGVAVALFRDGLSEARCEDDSLVVRQGRVTLTVYLWR